MSNPELIKQFVAYLRAERGAGENTLASYENDVAKFAAWFAKPLTAAVRLDLQRFVSDSMALGVSGRSAARRLSVLRHFYRFLLDEQLIEKDPTRNLPAPKQWKTLPKALSLADLDKMVASLGNSPLAIRDRAMLLTFFASGLRESELARLELRDLDLEAGVIKVWAGKGDKDGIVPLSRPAAAALKEYFKIRPEATSVVFPGRGGKPLSRMAIYQRISSVARTALGKHVSPHFLRHGFATALVEGGADIRDVQVLMRHSSVDTTAIYVHLDLNSLRRTYYATHPRARIVETKN